MWSDPTPTTPFTTNGIYSDRFGLGLDRDSRRAIDGCVEGLPRAQDSLSVGSRSAGCRRSDRGDQRRLGCIGGVVHRTGHLCPPAVGTSTEVPAISKMTPVMPG